MCYCEPDVRTPWCPKCPSVMYADTQKLKAQNTQLRENFEKLINQYASAITVMDNHTFWVKDDLANIDSAKVFLWSLE